MNARVSSFSNVNNGISKKGITVDRAKIEVIAKLPMPKCVKDIRSFSGHASFCWIFIKDFSKIARPLTNLIAKNVSLTFDEECINSWEKLKKDLISAPIISAPDWSKSFKIMCDAFNFAIGVVLGQRLTTSSTGFTTLVGLSTMLKWTTLQLRRNSW